MAEGSNSALTQGKKNVLVFQFDLGRVDFNKTEPKMNFGAPVEWD